MNRLRLGHWLNASGVMAAVIVAVLVNVLAGRHYRRWDFTRHRLYTLSPATLQTLRTLPERIRLDVLLAKDDPLSSSLQFLLRAYQAETGRLDIHVTDPDRQPAEFLALQQKYGIEAGKTDEGQIVTDAVAVMSRAEGKPFFVGAADLLDVRDGEAGEPRSKMEQTLTLTLRKVLENERPRVCFTSGHGELRASDTGPRGLGELAGKLTKNNYDVQEVESASPSSSEPFRECQLVVIGGPTQPFTAEEQLRLQRWLEQGGNLLLALGPVFDADQNRPIDLGLHELAARAGIAIDDDFIFERDPRRKLPGGAGDQFLAEAKAHAITQGLVGEQNRDLKILIKSARSLRVVERQGPMPASLLATSGEAFGMRDFFAWAKSPSNEPPRSGPQDAAGPLSVAMASELDPPSRREGRDGSDGEGRARGPRVVVMGTANLLFAQNWREPVLRGGAMFVESALSWLAARPVMVDVPDKPALSGAAGRLDEASLRDVYHYVVLYIPLAAALLGLAVYLRRRATLTEARGGARLRQRGAPH